jgi:hypothetical protein
MLFDRASIIFTTALYERMRKTTISSQEAITQVNALLTSAAQICTGNKATYQAKPKLKVWNADIKIAHFSHLIFPFGFGVFKLSSLLYSHLKDMLIG